MSEWQSSVIYYSSLMPMCRAWPLLGLFLPSTFILLLVSFSSLWIGIFVIDELRTTRLYIRRLVAASLCLFTAALIGALIFQLVLLVVNWPMGTFSDIVLTTNWLLWETAIALLNAFAVYVMLVVWPMTAKVLPGGIALDHILGRRSMSQHDIAKAIEIAAVPAVSIVTGQLSLRSFFVIVPRKRLPWRYALLITPDIGTENQLRRWLKSLGAFERINLFSVPNGSNEQRF